MQPAFPYRIRGQQLWLSPARCIFWEEERSLILADLHFGKTGHFRKAGIAVPQSVYREDLLHDSWYTKAGIELCPGVLSMGPFSFVHDITEVDGEVGDGSRTGAYYFSGHIHPGIRLRGVGKQSLQFPCFYFGGGYAVLPAFGRWTGTVSIDPAPEDNVFALLPDAANRILQIQ